MDYIFTSYFIRFYFINKSKGRKKNHENLLSKCDQFPTTLILSFASFTNQSVTASHFFVLFK